jgi:TRAP-type mannitol/chloroaromatic compound transport system permease large subunit
MMGPPYGLALFVLKGAVRDASMRDVWKASVAYMSLSIIALAFILIFPCPWRIRKSSQKPIGRAVL